MYTCSKCGCKQTVELGRCPYCKTWGSLSKDYKAPKVSREKAMYLDIWSERSHVSQLTGKRLLPEGHPQWHHQFLHVLCKSLYKKYKFNKRNILLALPEEHTKQESYPAFTKKQELLRIEYNLKFPSLKKTTALGYSSKKKYNDTE